MSEQSELIALEQILKISQSHELYSKIGLETWSLIYECNKVLRSKNEWVHVFRPLLLMKSYEEIAKSIAA